MAGLSMKYFVLNPSKEGPYGYAATFAIFRYADAIQGENPQLASDLRGWMDDLEREGIEMWKQYRRTGLSEMRPYVVGEDLTGISVSDEDTPKEGDMIARNPKSYEDQWLVAKEYFEDNLEPV